MEQKRKRRVARASSAFGRLLKLTIGLFLLWRYRLVAENLQVLKRLKPPYVLLPNHVTTWDPFFIGFFAPAPVYNVTSDFQFRRRIMRILHRLVGSIPKSKVIPDIETIKQIMEVRHNHGIIGIYPEGMRTWDGHTAETISQTAKLLKLLKIPVIAVVMKGAYLSLPRWTSRPRIGRVTITFRKIFSGPELGDLSPSEIQSKVDDALQHDEYEFQEGQMLAYRGSRPAENLELALFVCPECHVIGQLRSRGHRFRCESCGYSVWYNDFGFLERRKGPPHFQTVRDWNIWQQGYLEDEIKRRLRSRDAEPILSDDGLVLYVGHRTKPVRRRAIGRLSLYSDSLEFAPIHREPQRFPLSEVEGINVQIGERLEFYQGRVLHRFVSRDRSTSAYKWMCAVQILKRLTGLSTAEAAM